MNVRALCAICLALLLSVSHATPLAAQETPATTNFTSDPDGTDVMGAFVDSLRLLILEHGTRIAFQSKTRRELGGNFWTDYRRSVRMPPQWDDTDSFAVNYIGHPIHGAAAGYIWLDHDSAAPIEIDFSSRYWATRGKAAAWAAAYSFQFEWGPFSEASIGNVGMRPETTGWVDHVVTPTGAFGLMVAEDILDKYFVRWVEGRTGNRFVRASVRLILNPARALSNTASGQWPWHRDGRSIDWR